MWCFWWAVTGREEIVSSAHNASLDSDTDPGLYASFARKAYIGNVNICTCVLGLRMQKKSLKTYVYTNYMVIFTNKFVYSYWEAMNLNYFLDKWQPEECWTSGNTFMCDWDKCLSLPCGEQRLLDGLMC